METGKLIFLNGVTSVGKTTIAKAIQQIAQEPFYHLSNDMFFPVVQAMLHDRYIREAGEKAQSKYMAEAILWMYRFAKAVTEQGVHVIIDGMLEEREGFLDFFGKTNYDSMRDIFQGAAVLMVEVACPLEECRRRNIARGDRGEFQSHEQQEVMNKTVRYDVTVDTSADSAAQCAGAILQAFYGAGRADRPKPDGGASG